MTSLTTRQRDILELLLTVDKPIGTEEIADSVRLSPRQVNYSMKGIDRWLKARDACLQAKPGVGTIIDCQPEQRNDIIKELEGASRLHLVLTPEQRQQLLCLYLLFENEPVILAQLTRFANVSRTTILADLDAIEAWLGQRDLQLERKQNYGFLIEGTEKFRQQAILYLLWGETPFGKSLFSASYQKGLQFTLHKDAHFLPLVEEINEKISQIDLKKILNKIVLVEDFLVGRFTDEGVLYLSLVISLLLVRAQSGMHIEASPIDIKDLKVLPAWEAAVLLMQNLDEVELLSWTENDIAYLEMNILSSPRVDSWPSDVEQEKLYRELSNELINEVSRTYEIEALLNDLNLREGLINHLVPVCNQQKFNLWFPEIQAGLSSESKYKNEFNLARIMIDIIQDHTELEFPAYEVNMIAALLRAAYIRLRPYHFKKVLVICPSGMVTAQLLTARLTTRFPRLGKLTVISYRELDPDMIAQADLIITLMPLSEDLVKDKPVIQVSAQLLPEDVEAITNFLT